MRNFFALVCLLSMVFAYPNLVSAKQSDEEIADKQGELISIFEEELADKGLDIKSLEDVGNYYFNEDQIVIQLDVSKKDEGTSFKETEKFKTLAKSAQSLSERFSANFVIEEVSNSYNYLVETQDQIAVDLHSLKVDNYVINLNAEENRLDLIFDEISNETRKSLQGLYDEDLKIIVDKEALEKFNATPEAAKPRKADWNSLGAGIGIRKYTGGGECSTAGIAKKGSDLWVMSAGHCNDGGVGYIQWSSRLGTTHLNAYNSDYDFLLIKVQNSPIKRYATNGLYGMWGDTSTGYDASLTGSFKQKKGLRVCRVGIKTSRACGEVTNERYRTGLLGRGLVLSEVSGNGEVLSNNGDSGGSWFTQSRPYRLVGVHKGGNGGPGVGSTTSFFTPWVEVADKYGLSLYTSSTPTPMN